jgi:hypothetical protein
MFASRLIRVSALMTLMSGLCLSGDEPADTAAIDLLSAADAETPDAGPPNAGPPNAGQPADELAPLRKDEEVEYRLELESGRTIDVGEIFRAQGETFYQSLNTHMRLAKSSLLRINHQQSTQPMLLASRRGKVLHGPFASFFEDGAPVALISYTKGERNSSLLTWDEANRPLVFAQYQAGQLDGIRCLFQGCCEQCRSGHIWMVQEWDRGELLAAHVVGDDGRPQSFQYRGGVIYGSGSSALALATTTLRSVEKRIEGDELKLKQFISLSYERERQAAYDEIRFRTAQMSYKFMATMYQPSVPVSRARVVM